MTRARKPPFAVLVAVACVGVPLTASAQFQDPQTAARRMAEEAANVYVRDSGVAVEKLALGERLERQKEWDKAGDVYTELSLKFADRVVPGRKDDKGRVAQYVSAARVVQDRISAWPAEGVAAYRRRFEDVARDLLNSDDPAAAAKVVDVYFATDAGRDAALRRMSEAFESGNLSTAATIGRRLLDSHPGLAAERPRVLLQTGVAEHLAGRDNDAKTRLDELRAKFPDVLARVAGEDVKAADALAAAIAVAPPRAEVRGDSWPTAFGSPDASSVPSCVSGGGARMFGVELTPVSVRGATVNNSTIFKVQWANQRRGGLSTGVLPAVDAGTLYFQDNARVYAVDLATGTPVAGWQQTAAGAPRGGFAIDALPTPQGKQLAVTLSSNSVVALLGQNDLNNQGQFGYPMQEPQLVNLDRATGRRLWTVSPRRLKLPEDQANLRQGVFYGTPLVDDDTVYMLVGANRGGQFDECYVVALRLSDGSYKWSTYVASTSQFNRFGLSDDDGGQFSVGTAAAVSLSAGRLYVMTNLGALACLDADAGHVQWLNIYSRKPPTTSGRGFSDPQRQGQTKPYLLGPPVVADGRVFAMPVDSQSLIVCDAADGALVRELPRKLDDSDSLQPARALLGVVGDSVLLANTSTVFKVPWRTFDTAKSLIDNGGVFKKIPPGENDKGDPNDTLRGRPFVTSNALLVPGADRLYRISMRSFKIESEYPNNASWAEDESTGNVIATPDNLIIAGPQRVTIYADLAAATAKLDARIQADPNDVEAYTRYAELLFAAGQSQAALARLDEAFEKLGGTASLTPGAARDRLFEVATSFAAKFQRASADAALVDALFDRAAAAARTPQQQVRYRVARANAYRAAADGPAELALHQQILANPLWRAVPTTAKPGQNTAGEQAEAAVAELIRQFGPPIYASYDKAAADKLAELQSAETPDTAALLALADEYPLAKSTPDAVTLAADAFEAANQPRRATLTLRRLLRRDLSNERRQIVLQSLARNSLRTPSQVDIARVRLKQARSLAPNAKLAKPLVMPDGKPLEATTVADAVAALESYAGRSFANTLPTLNVPGSAGGNRKAPLTAAVEVAPATAVLTQQADLARSNRVVFWNADKRVGMVDTDSLAVTWTEAAADEAPVGGGYLGDTLVVAAPNEVSAVDAAGKRLWKATLAALPAVEATAEGTAVAAGGPAAGGNGAGQIINGPFGRNRGGLILRNGRLINRLPVPVPAIDPPDETPAATTERITQCRLSSDRVIVATSTGRVAAFDATSGSLAWQARAGESAVTRLLSNDDFVVAGIINPGNGSAVYAFDSVTGRVVQAKTYDGNTNPAGSGLVNVGLSPDGVLVTMQAGRLTGIDLYDPGSGDWKFDPGANRVNNGMFSPFQLSNLPDQLVITSDRVLAVTGGLNEQQSVRAYDLRSLKPILVKDPKTGRDAEIPYGARANDAEARPLSILAAGSQFYVVGTKSIAAYDLDNVDNQWTPQGGSDRKTTVGVALAQDYVVLLAPRSAAAAPDADKLPDLQLFLYSRARVPAKGNAAPRESGVLEQRPTLRDPAQFVNNAWQITDGGFFYVSGDGKLKACRANR